MKYIESVYCITYTFTIKLFRDKKEIFSYQLLKKCILFFLRRKMEKLSFMENKYLLSRCYSRRKKYIFKYTFVLIEI